MVSGSCSTTITELPPSRSWLQQANQPLIIFLMQADARLVENIEHSRQARTDLGRQPHPLELAAR